jgi:hypothetical protein
VRVLHAQRVNDRQNRGRIWNVLLHSVVCGVVVLCVVVVRQMDFIDINGVAGGVCVRCAEH